MGPPAWAGWCSRAKAWDMNPQKAQRRGGSANNILGGKISVVRHSEMYQLASASRVMAAEHGLQRTTPSTRDWDWCRPHSRRCVSACFLSDCFGRSWSRRSQPSAVCSSHPSTRLRMIRSGCISNKGCREKNQMSIVRYHRPITCASLHENATVCGPRGKSFHYWNGLGYAVLNHL